MFKTFTLRAMIAALFVSAMVPVATAPAEARNRGAKIAAGVVLGAAALAIIANSNRARAETRYYAQPRPRYNSYASTCERWYHKCMNGNDWACEKFETRGCTE